MSNAVAIDIVAASNASNPGVINIDAVSNAALSHEPYDFFLASDFLRQEAVQELREHFPDIRKPGYLTVDEVSLQGGSRRSSTSWKGPS